MDDLLQWFESWIRHLGPNRYFQAGVLIVLSLLAAKLANFILGRVLKRWSEKTRTDVDDRLIAILRGPVFLTFVLLGLGLATIRVALPETPTQVTLAALQTIGVAIWLAFGFRFSRILLDLLGRRQEASALLQARTLPLIDNVIKIALIGVATYFVFLAWKIDLTAWVASAGIIGIAVGFAAKDSLANIISGISILADAPYKVGDYVVLDTGEGGQIGHIGMRSTRMMTRDDIEITIPNSVMANSKVINESGGPNPKRRIRIRVGVAYGSDIDKVRALLLEAGQSHSQVCDAPEPRVRFRAFGDSGLDFELLCWVNRPVLRGEVQDALNVAVYKTFAKEEVEIPYPKRDVYIRDWPQGSPESSDS